MNPLRVAASLAAGLLLVACGSQGDGSPGAGPDSPSSDEFNQAFAPDAPYPLVVSSELVVGDGNRFLIALQDETDAPVANPAIDMTIQLFNLAESSTEPISETAMDFVWTIKPYVGLFVGYVDLPAAGRWGVQVDAAGKDFEGEAIEVSAKTSFEVTSEGTTPAIGESVPPSDTPTSKDAPVAKISTDTNPDPRFYELSVSDAVEAGRPFVLTFATPKFCDSQVCGPTLDIVKRVSKSFPKVNFLHIEPYDLEDPTAKKVVPAVGEWGLPGEPWVFVVGADGKLVAKYEGTVGAEELTAALERV